MHREEISYADNFSEQLSRRLSSPSVFGPRDMWRFGRLLMFSPKDKKRIVKFKAHSDPQNDSNIEEINELTAPEDNDSDEIREMKRLGLYLMNEMADFHERIKKYSLPSQFCSRGTHGFFQRFHLEKAIQLMDVSLRKAPWRLRISSYSNMI